MKTITKLLLVAGIALAMLGCGNESDATKTSAYTETEACTGLTAYQPPVDYLQDAIWPYDPYDGYYNGSTVLIKASLSDDVLLHKHEYIHHLLQVNYGDLDQDHNSVLFEKCAPGTTTPV